jgi:hypothetical protein
MSKRTQKRARLTVARLTGYGALLADIAAQISSGPIVQASLAQLSWYHHLALSDKLEKRQDRFRNAAKAVEYGWS